MSAKAQLIVSLLVSFALALLIAFGAHSIYKAGTTKQVNKELAVGVKTAQKETKNATANAAISKKTARDNAADRAKGAKALKEIEDAAKTSPARDCLSPEQLRVYNDPLGDAEAAGGRGVPRGVSDRSPPVFGWDGRIAHQESRGVDADAAGLRAQAQRARGAGEATPQVSIVEQRLKQFFPTEAGQ
ncbi:MAG: hypothetical protein ACXWG8_10315 [Usitatibacter sp.]